MAAKQSMMQAITQATTEAAKATIMPDKDRENPVNTAGSVLVMTRTAKPSTKAVNI